MEKATFIKAEDLMGLVVNEDGTIQIPDHIEIFIREDPKVTIQKKIDELEEELSIMKEPTDEELIEEGRMMNRYFHLNEELEQLKEEIK